MYETFHAESSKLRWLIFSVPILFAMMVMLSVALSPPVIAVSVTGVAESKQVEEAVKIYDSPNAITNGTAEAADQLARNVKSVERTIDGAGQTIGVTGQSVVATASYITTQTAGVVGHGAYSSVAFVGRELGSSAAFVGHSLSASIAFMARGVGNGVAFVFHIPGAILGFAADTTLVSAVIKPADSDSTAVPTIGPVLPDVVAAAVPAVIVSPAAAQSADQTAPHTVAGASTDSVAAWPIHGAITTLFGVPHWPYQPTHTGIDISDGQRPGVTPIKPFRPGRVIDTVRSNSGLGNHVIIDHGEGLTSLYGHLASISVQPGQAVDKNTVLGLEGSTGTSTGTHLHFEISLHGQVKDPRQFIGGQP